MKNNKTALVIFTVFMVIGLYCVTHYHYRLKIDNNRVYQAAHLELPGYITVGKPADTIHLSAWSGSKSGVLTITIPDSLDPKKMQLCKELNAELVLKMTGLADSTYKLEKIGEHFVLISPEKHWKEWSWRAPYRFTSWEYQPDIKAN